MLDTIRKLYSAEQAKPNGRPLNALWKWAMAGKNAKDREERFDALQRWARLKEKNADDRHTRHLWDAASESYQKKERANRKVRKEQEREREEADHSPGPMKGTVIYDGCVVPAWMVSELDFARSHGWNGGVISGVRTPAHSIAICQSMCGANSCSGTCAGASSNHNATAPVTDGEGAIDITDYITFKRLVEPRGKLFNRLAPADPNHFSRSGR